MPEAPDLSTLFPYAEYYTITNQLYANEICSYRTKQRNIANYNQQFINQYWTLADKPSTTFNKHINMPFASFGNREGISVLVLGKVMLPHHLHILAIRQPGVVEAAVLAVGMIIAYVGYKSHQECLITSAQNLFRADTVIEYNLIKQRSIK